MGRSLEKLCAISSSSSSSSSYPLVWQQMGLPCLVTQTETQEHEAAEQPVDKPGNQNPGEEAET